MAAGQLLTALKKVSERRISRSRSGRGGGMDRHTEEHIQKAIKRLQQVWDTGGGGSHSFPMTGRLFSVRAFYY